MIQKGFYIRGGIAIGSYFSNDKMIFSGGLVKAYKIETKAKNPIVVISDEILNRIKKNNSSSIPGISLADSLVYHIENPQKVFINPFESIDNSSKNIDYIEKSLTDLIAKTKESGSDDPLDKLSDSIFSLLGTFAQPLLKVAKNTMTEDLLIKTKQNVLEELKLNIIKCEERRMSLIDQGLDASIEEKVMTKLKYFEEFVNWSIEEKEHSKFRKLILE